MHSDYDSAESIADSDFEDGELRKMVASPLYIRGRGKIPTLLEIPEFQGNLMQWFYRREEQVHNVLKLITQQEKA